MAALDAPAAARSGVAREASLLLLARVLSALAGFASLRVLTTVMSEGLYGRYSLLLGYLALIGGFFVGPLAQAQNRFLHESVRDGSLRSFVGWATKSSIIAAMIGSAVAVPLAWRYFGDDPSWPAVAAWCALAAVAGALATRQQGLFNTYRWRGRYALLSVIDAWARPGLVIASVVLIGASLHAVAAALAASTALVAAVGLPWLLLLAAESAPKSREACRFDPAPAWRFALPLFGVTLLGWVTSLSDRYVLSHFLGDALVGRYVASYQMAGIVPGLVGSLFFPLVSPMLFEEMARVESHELALDRYLEAVALPGLLLGAALLSDLQAAAALLLGRSVYFTGDLIVPWVFAALWLMTIQQVLEHAAFHRQATRGLLLANGSGALVNLALNLALVPQFGMMVAATSTLAAYAVSTVVVIALYRPSVALRTWGRLGLHVVGAAIAIVLARWLVPESLPLLLRGPLRWLLGGALVAAVMLPRFIELWRWRRGSRSAPSASASMADEPSQLEGES